MNDLRFENSPYLLQHAGNPVNWKAWKDDSLALAANENKLVVISIGYSTCHWCHVMEQESFEDTEVAGLMNKHFIAIKVDREERPDVDAHYMKVLHLLNQRGGWPLNVVCLPDGRPVWGGTYFRKHDWMKALQTLQEYFETNAGELYEYAERLSEGIGELSKAPFVTSRSGYFDREELMNKWRSQLDNRYGGYGKAPKFMMPNSLVFLQKYGYLKEEEDLLRFIDLTLTQMARGGIFDTVQGGFSRYSVDERWHIPHFEKMLYDNAQLLTLYADGYKRTKNPLYREVIEKTVSFIREEWSNGEGGFYAAYDADSLDRSGKLEEGAYYSWTEEELKRIIGQEDFAVFRSVFNINPQGHWENGRYVLIQTEELKDIAHTHHLTEESLSVKKKNWEDLLRVERNNRAKPRLDDKTLTSWNAMLAIGLLDAYTAWGEESYLSQAAAICSFIDSRLTENDTDLKHTFKNGKATIDGFLEDYAFYISALIAMYEHSLDTEYLNKARKLTDKVFDRFYDEESRFFFFNDRKNIRVIQNSVQTDDGVIPSANSQMAHNLLKLGILFEQDRYTEVAGYMLENVREHIKSASYYSNWLLADLYYSEPAELLVTGMDAQKEVLRLRSEILTKTLLFGSREKSDIPYLKGKFGSGSTLFHFCTNRSCLLPQSSNGFLKEYTL